MNDSMLRFIVTCYTINNKCYKHSKISEPVFRQIVMNVSVLLWI